MAHVANLTIDNTKVSADATDFPVYVNLADMNATFWSTVSNGGGDIRVFKSDGTTELPREVVSCETSTETGELHFKYTGTLSSSTDTEVQIHADGTSSDYAVGATYGRNAVWSDYNAVYHTENTDDSAGNHNATGTNLADATGKIGTAQTFNGTNSRFNCGTSNDFDYTTAGTLTAWIKPTSNDDFKRIFDRTSGSGGFTMATRSPGSIISFFGKGSGLIQSSSGTISAGVFQKITVRITGTTSTIYKNGSQVATGSTTIPSASGATLDVGNAGGFSVFNGVIDEVRLRPDTISTGWETTEYNNQNSPSTFYTVTDATTDYPLTAEVGAFTLTGIDVTLNRMINLVAEVGEFTLTGFNAILSKGFGLVAEVGNFALTGIDATLTSARTMSVTVGNFALTGINATFVRGVNLVAETGSFILTGFSAIIRRPGFRNLAKNIATGISNRVKNSATVKNRNKS